MSTVPSSLPPVRAALAGARGEHARTQPLLVRHLMLDLPVMPGRQDPAGRRLAARITTTLWPCSTHAAGLPDRPSTNPPYRAFAHTALVLALLTGAACARAADAAIHIPFDSSLWLKTGFWSHHTAQRRTGAPYNQKNIGLGLEWQFARSWQLNAGHYRNSVNRASNYLQVGWSPLSWSPVEDLSFTAGVSVGVVNGYPNIASGYFPTLVPMTSVEWRQVGVNLVYIPSVGRIHGAYAAQLKLKLY